MTVPDESSDGGRRLPMTPVLLAAACALALVRFHGLDRWSLWIDEVYTLADSLFGESFRNPLGYGLYRLVLGDGSSRPDEAALRWLPAVLGVATVPLTWLAFRSLVGGRAAAAGALLVAASSWHLFWSQTADFYTLAMAVSLAGTGLVLRALRTGGVAVAIAGLGVCSLAALAHPSAVFLPPALVAGPWLLWWAGVRLPGLEGRLRWVLLAVGGAGLVVGGGWMVSVWLQWLETLKSANPAHFVLTTGFYVTPVLGAAALVSAWRSAVQRDPAGLLLVAVVGLGLVGAGIASVTARVSAQYVFCLLPWIAVLAALPVRPVPSGAPEPPAWRTWGWVAVLLLPLATDTLLYFTTRHGERPRWKEAYRYVWNERGADDLVFGMAAPVGEYYLGDHLDLRRVQRRVAWLDRFRAEAPSAWARHPRTAWYVVNHEELEDWPDPDTRAAFERMLARDCTQVAAFPVQMEARDINVYVYRRGADG